MGIMIIIIIMIITIVEKELLFGEAWRGRREVPRKLARIVTGKG